MDSDSNKAKTKRSGNTILIDGYFIATEDAAQYVTRREQLALRVETLMASFCHSVKRCWAGSEDGEAVVGFYANGTIASLLHLDPDAVYGQYDCSDEELMSLLKS